MKTKKTLLLCILLSVFLSSTNGQVLSDLWGDALGTENTSYSNRRFFKILDRAKTKAVVDAQINHNKLRITEYEETSEYKTWHVPIYATDQTSEYDREVSYQIIPSAFMNYGDRFEFVYLSPEIKEKILEDFKKEGTLKNYFENLQEEAIDEYDDMKFEVSLVKNQIMLYGKYSYSEGVSSNEIEERQVYLQRLASGIQSYVMISVPTWENKIKTELREKDFKYFTKDEFVTLTGYNFDKYEEEYEPAKEGYYALTLGGNNHVIYNYGDSLVLNVWIDAPKDIEEEDIDKILEEINEEIMDDSFSESRYSRVNIYEKWPTTYWLEVSFDISKGFNGADFEELFDSYVSEYSIDFIRKN